MSSHSPRIPHYLSVEEAADLEPQPMPVALDEGRVATMIPDDPEHDLMVDPED